MRISFAFLLLISIFTLSCKTSKTLVVAEEFEEEMLDTLVVSASPIEKNKPKSYKLDPYRASATRTHDLIHTKLELAFDWQKQHVLGKAELTLKPYFYETDILELDAKNFIFNTIKINGALVEYDYDLKKITIKLDKPYKRDEIYKVNIDYTARPNEGPSSGSAAITSDKGLFFINPNKENKDKPSQIWTQGETENNSRWFPTIDKPNERCSQEIFITVEDKYQTLSNGKLISSSKNQDGTRTDYWKQESPHAPYLFMLGIGEYAVINDTWNGMPLMYYVEAEFEKDAKKIFNHTPEMLQFFSDLLDFEYPWDKYAQIVCRDYVSGAMENTGAVIFGQFVQKSARELLDGDNDDIVAHEMFHHWFGDLVTCESWSNLTLNEGFATYSEYLWREYKYGHASAENKRLQDLNGYLMSAGQQGTHDLIDFEYKDKEQMFDQHSYNKGGLIIHMLRTYLGDEAFFASLNKYLKTNAYTDVEAHELRLAFEDTVGEDLNWFFNQWFYNEGHPILEVNNTINSESKQVVFDVKQIQDPEKFLPIFQFPVESALYYPSGKVEFVKSWIDKRDQEVVIPIEGDEMPAVVVFDGKHDLLAVFKENYTSEEQRDLFLYSKEYQDKHTALRALKGNKEMDALYVKALSDPSEQIRSMAVNAVKAETFAKKLNELALNDSNSAVRANALKKTKDLKTAQALVQKDQSFRVIGEALTIINKQDPKAALKELDILTQGYHKPLIPKIAEIYAGSKDEKYLPFFEDNLSNVGMFGFFNYMNQYGKVAQNASQEGMIQTAKVLKDFALEDSNTYFKKYSATNLINQMIKDLSAERTTETDQKLEKTIDQLQSDISEIVNKSTETRLKNSFKEYLIP